MKIYFQDYLITIVNISDKILIEQSMKDFKENVLKIGTVASSDTTFWGIKISSAFTENPYLGIYFSQSVPGPFPGLYLYADNIILIGNDFDVFGIDLAQRKIIFHIQLESPFRSFVHCERQNKILIANEAGFIALNESWQVIWQYEREIINTFDVNDSTITINFLENTLVETISINTGETID